MYAYALEACLAFLKLGNNFFGKRTIIDIKILSLSLIFLNPNANKNTTPFLMSSLYRCVPLLSVRNIVLGSFWKQ